MTIVVTGAAGFIGSNLVQALNARGVSNVLAVDNLQRAEKFPNLVPLDIEHFMDKNDFIQEVRAGLWKGKIEAIFHQGACSDTMNHDGKYMMSNNYQYTVDLFEFCQAEGIPFIFASSAATYGKGEVFKEGRENEGPLNIYGYSKFQFDQYLRRKMKQGLKAQAVGFRYFNVYGPNEEHKGRMASVAFHNFHQYQTIGQVKLFGAYDGYADGTQSRDFVFVEDVVKVNLFFLDNPSKSGIFNLGSGRAQPFNDVAKAVVNSCRKHEGKAALSLTEMVAQEILIYTEFPDALKGKYQSFTEADISKLRDAGYTDAMSTVEEGVESYVTHLLSRS